MAAVVDVENGRVYELCAQVGRRVRELRLKAGLTQAVLAEQVGVEPESINRLERGVLVPSLRLLVRLSGVLNAPVAEMFSGFGFKKPVVRRADVIRRMVKRLRGLPERDLPVLEAVVMRFGRGGRA